MQPRERANTRSTRPRASQRRGDCQDRLHVPTSSQVGVVARALDLLLSHLVGLPTPCDQLALDGNCDLKRDGSHHGDEHIADGLVDGGAGDNLADRCSPIDALALAGVRWVEPLYALVVANRHPVTARATGHDALQQRWPFSRGTVAPVFAMCLRVLTKPALIV